MKRIVLAAVAVLTFGTAVAQSPQPNAMVRAEAGVVQVRNGATVAVGDGSVGINAGDTVTVAEGQATVVYADGCTIPVTGSHQIAAVSPCKAGLVPSKSVRAAGDGKFVWGALGAAVAVGVAVGGGSDDKPSSP